MDLGLDEDLTALKSAIRRVADDFSATPTGSPAYWRRSEALEQALQTGGYYDAMPAFGVIGAALLIEAVGRTPYVVELVGSALVAPGLGLDGLGQSLAICDASAAGAVRFACQAENILIDAGDHVRLLADPAATPVETFLAYPFGALRSDWREASQPIADVPLERFRTLRRIGVAAEILGAIDRALEVTTEYARDRQQFGRPIGAFQAIAHRLAECAVLVHGVRLLVHRAAVTAAPADAVAALAYAQDAAKRLIWESNQIHGAIALTLEYPAHYWNYRLRALQGEQGGLAANLRELYRTWRT